MYKIIKTLQPYFCSIRQVQESAVLDIKIPLFWNPEAVKEKYPNVIVHVQDKNETSQLLMMISAATEEGYGELILAAQELIKINKEEEQKQELFRKMVADLQNLFKNESLDNIKGINLFEKHESDSKGTGTSGEGEVESPEGNTKL